MRYEVCQFRIGNAYRFWNAQYWSLCFDEPMSNIESFTPLFMFIHEVDEAHIRKIALFIFQLNYSRI